MRRRIASGTSLLANAEGICALRLAKSIARSCGPISPKLLASASARLDSVIRPMALASPMANAGRPHSSASIATRPAPITRSQLASRAGTSSTYPTNSAFSLNRAKRSGTWVPLTIRTR
ncbi:hypothetical protein D3C85_1465350 [compost metagenome]